MNAAKGSSPLIAEAKCPFCRLVVDVVLDANGSSESTLQELLEKPAKGSLPYHCEEVAKDVCRFPFTVRRRRRCFFLAFFFLALRSMFNCLFRPGWFSPGLREMRGLSFPRCSLLRKRPLRNLFECAKRCFESKPTNPFDACVTARTQIRHAHVCHYAYETRTSPCRHANK